MKAKRLNSTSQLSRKPKIRIMSNTQLKPPKSIKSGTIKLIKHPSIQISPIETCDQLDKTCKILRNKLVVSTERKSQKSLTKNSTNSTHRSQATKENFDLKHQKTLSQTLSRSPKSAKRNPSFCIDYKQQTSRVGLTEKLKIVQTPKLYRPGSSDVSETKLNNILQKFMQFKENHFSIINSVKYK